jgi:serine/threonine-protein kinase
MGEVFAAENIRTGRPVAIKLLRQDSKTKSSAVARFRQEARAAGSINSDHVTQVLDVEEDTEHGVVLVFELLEGESLIDRLKRTGPIPFDELWPIIEQVWLGLADAHRAGIIHRDLKPSNVFLERRPDGSTRVKILDFGISKVPKEVGGETLTEMGQSLGTFSFMPPEQIGKAKMVDHRADIYACATLIFQSLTGQLPYAARNILVMVEMKSKTDARKLAEVMNGPVDPRLEAFVQRGLARDANERFQSALDALAAWRELRPSASAGQPLVAQPSGVPVAPSSFASGPNAQTPLPGAASRLVAPTPVVESSSAPRLPVVADMTTDESVATVAMPRAQIANKPASSASGQMPRIDPRLDSAAASINVISTRGVGPGGTQLVTVQRGPKSSPASERKARPEEPTVAEDKGALRPHPVGYYIPPQVAATLGRGPTQPAPAAPVTGSGHVPKIYEDTSQPSSGENEGATQVYRPTGDTARRLEAPQLPANAPVVAAPKRGMPVAMVLLGFLVIGFVAVAGAIYLFKR